MMKMTVLLQCVVVTLLTTQGGCTSSQVPPDHPSEGQEWNDPISGIAFRYCPPGKFLMGGQKDSHSYADDQSPQHAVTISRGFWIGKTEVTQAQWKVIMKDNPSSFKGDDRPVETVSWFDCSEYINKLNKKTSNCRYRFPTEAEWEYVCGLGNQDPDGENLPSIAWYKDISGDETKPVGAKKANHLGLFDMLGNVREWCSDWRGSYAPSGAIDPKGPETGKYKINRGGSWACEPYALHRAFRWYYTPDFKDNDLGLRLILTSGK